MNPFHPATMTPGQWNPSFNPSAMAQAPVQWNPTPWFAPPAAQPAPNYFYMQPMPVMMQPPPPPITLPSRQLLPLNSQYVQSEIVSEKPINYNQNQISEVTDKIIVIRHVYKSLDAQLYYIYETQLVKAPRDDVRLATGIVSTGISTNAGRKELNQNVNLIDNASKNVEEGSVEQSADEVEQQDESEENEESNLDDSIEPEQKVPLNGESSNIDEEQSNEQDSPDEQPSLDGDEKEQQDESIENDELDLDNSHQVPPNEVRRSTGRKRSLSHDHTSPILNQSNAKAYSCTWPNCGYSYDHHSSAAEHIRTKHFKLPRTKTEQATLDIVDDRDPNQYIRQNSNIKFVCKLLGCNKSFDRVKLLARHKRTHLKLKIKPFSCKWPACGHSSEHRNAIVKHIRTRHFHLPVTVKEQIARQIIDHRDPHEYIEVDQELLKLSGHEKQNVDLSIESSIANGIGKEESGDDSGVDPSSVDKVELHDDSNENVESGLDNNFVHLARGIDAPTKSDHEEIEQNVPLGKESSNNVESDEKASEIEQPSMDEVEMEQQNESKEESSLCNSSKVRQSTRTLPTRIFYFDYNLPQRDDDRKSNIRPKKANRFACTECHKSFDSDSKLVNHERIHLKIKPFSCKWPECHYSSEQRGAVVLHIRTQHFHLPATVQEQIARQIIDHRDPNEYLEVDQELANRRLA